jgi:hypothetical protein
MRTIAAPLLMLALLASLACEKRTDTQTVTDSTGTVEQKSTTVSTTVPSVDTAATAAAKQDAKDAAHETATAARDAAHATGTAMETAGKEIQRRTSPERKH